MLKRVIEISSDHFKLSLSKGFLIVTDVRTNQVNQIPLDSILCLIISAHNVLISKNIVNALCENQACLIFCNDKYMPAAITLPIVGHWLTSARIKAQTALPESLRKNLWKKIVQMKISNQAKLLAFVHPNSTIKVRLQMLSKTVKNDDLQNNEGQAAHLYFNELFGSDFIRNRNAADINMLLNYAYTILRAMVARSVCANGLLPYLGLKHCQSANTMPLVDDLIEPFRPFADQAVLDILKMGSFMGQLTPEIKRVLAGLTAQVIYTDKGKLPLAEVINDFVLSLVKSYQEKKNLLINICL